MKLKPGLACRQWVELLLLLCSNASGTLVSILLAYGQPCTGHNHHSDLPYGLQPGDSGTEAAGSVIMFNPSERQLVTQKAIGDSLGLHAGRLTSC